MLRPKLNIENLLLSTHGGINNGELERLGISPENILDFSVSTNPFGPPPGIRKSLEQTSVSRYPDSEAGELKSLIAEKLSMTQDNLLVGSGSTELIRLIATSYFGPGDQVIIPGPTYGEYETTCHIVGAEVLKEPMMEEACFRLNVVETVDLILKRQPRGIFLCNPNNPTGQYLSQEEVKEILTIAGDTLVILDEAYIAFTDRAWVSTDLIGSCNLVILRSMTKDYALAGLRLGYAVASQTIISILQRVKPPWNVSSVAQAAGVFVLKADGYLEECREKIKTARDFLMAGLKELGLSPLPSQTNFFLVKIGDAANFKQNLLSKGLLVRDCTSFGLPDYIRIAPRSMADCQKLLTTIKDIGEYRNAG
jgi:histidinol-phosphate aminotransferase